MTWCRPKLIKVGDFFKQDQMVFVILTMFILILLFSLLGNYFTKYVSCLKQRFCSFEVSFVFFELEVSNLHHSLPMKECVIIRDPQIL